MGGSDTSFQSRILLISRKRVNIPTERWTKMRNIMQLRMLSSLFLCGAWLTVASPPAFALIMGGEGNRPVADPGWPKGAAVIFNVKARIAYWEGPPYGGGQWHAECRGDAKALSEVLADFAKLDVK